jgi:carbamate kinase
MRVVIALGGNAPLDRGENQTLTSSNPAWPARSARWNIVRDALAT